MKNWVLEFEAQGKKNKDIVVNEPNEFFAKTSLAKKLNGIGIQDDEIYISSCREVESIEEFEQLVNQVFS